MVKNGVWTVQENKNLDKVSVLDKMRSGRPHFILRQGLQTVKRLKG